jgi:alpha-mannosidase
MSEKYKFHLIINTHWDREWRWSLLETQKRLKVALDLLIETMENDERFKAFHTDAQSSMIDDYLEICPENRERVEKLIQDGRLLVGPWYTLPAEYLVNGEALTRNLLLGHRQAAEYGRVMKVAYNIFSWGQVSQLPQIYRQFGMDTIFFYRGIDATKLNNLEFWWEAPDGNRSLGVTFGSNHRINFWAFVYYPYVIGDGLGYDRSGEKGYVYNLCDGVSTDNRHHLVNQHCHKDEANALRGMRGLLDSLKDKASTNELVAFQGFDHENPDVIVPDLVDFVNENFEDAEVVISTLPEYVDCLKAKLKKTGKMDALDVVKGEMLDVEKIDSSFGRLFAGVFSARMPYKLANFKCENNLIHWAEPCATWASLYGEEYPAKMLSIAWKSLLQNQQHDGIGGCHVDKVTLTSMERFRNVDDVSEIVTQDSLERIITEIDLSIIGNDELGVVVFNPHNYEYSGVVDTQIDMPRDVSGLTKVTDYNEELDITITDGSGNIVPHQTHRQRTNTAFVTRRFGANTMEASFEFQVSFEAKDVPAFGFKKYKVALAEGVARPLENIASGPNAMENEHLKVLINTDGTLDITDKRTGEFYTGLHHFEDSGDMGGPLYYQEPDRNVTYNTKGRKVEISLVQSGALSAVYRVEHEWPLPEGLDLPLESQIPNGATWRKLGYIGRSKDRKVVRISTDIALRKGSKLVEFATTVDNRCKYHRLRAVFRPNIHCETIHADIPYDVVERRIARPDSSGWAEESLKCYPSHSFLDVCDDKNAKRGLAIIHGGISEYEALNDSQGTIALTLLRCFGVAGGNKDTFQAQELTHCPGKHTFRYALYPHGGNWDNAEVVGETYKFNMPPRIAEVSAHQGSIKEDAFSYMKVANEKLVVTAVKQAENGQDVVLRCFNPTKTEITSAVRPGFNIREAKRVTLEEIEEGDLLVRDNVVNITVKPGEISTVLLKR